MKKTRIAIGVVAVLAVGAVAVTAFATGGAPFQGAPIASKIDDHGKLSSQEALSRYVVGQQTYLLDKTSDPDARAQIILVTNYYMLATMTPGQQRVHKTEVLQVEKYRPGGDWNKALAAPTMLNELLKTSAEQERKLAAIVEAADEATSAVISAPGFANLPRSQRAAQLQAVRTDLNTKFMQALTPAQRSEWNRFVGLVDADLNRAARGEHVIAGK